jgi:hypothetical protein
MAICSLTSTLAALSCTHLARVQMHPHYTVSAPVQGRKHGTYLVITTSHGRLFLVCSVVGRTDTQVISVCPMTGTLQYRAMAGIDLFPSGRLLLLLLCVSVSECECVSEVRESVREYDSTCVLTYLQRT